MGHKLENNQYDHLDSFITDAQLVFDNCKTYNPEGTIYHRNAVKLEKFLKDQLKDRIKKEESG
jgi:histone acetyltransferase